MPTAEPTRSHLRIWRHGWAVAATTSSVEMPRALASIRARSCSDTISWSRSRDERSFMKNRAATKTTREVTPEMTNWLLNPELKFPLRKWSRVRVATTLVIRLPATGPTVQKPMAEARPSCGLKSRTRAGVATRMAPSTRPRMLTTMANDHSVVVAGIPMATRRPMTSRP